MPVAKFSSKIAIIFIGNLLHRLGSMATIPFIVFYMLNHITNNAIVVGVISSANVFAAAIVGVIAGIYIDRFNPRIIFLSALAGLIVAFALLGISAELHSLSGIFCSDLCIGACGSIFELAIKVYISSNFPPEMKAKAFTFRYSGINAGSILGPAVGAWFSLHGGTMMFIYTIAVLICVWLFYFILLKHNPLQVFNNPKYNLLEVANIIFSHKALLLLTSAFFMFQFSYSFIDSVLPMTMRLRLSNYSLTYANLLSLNGLVVCILSFGVGFIIHKLDLHRITFYSLLLMGLSYVFFAFATSSNIYYLAMILLSVGEVAYASCVNIHIDRLSDHKNPGLFFGASNFSLIGGFCGPAIGSTIFYYSNGLISFMLPTLLMVLSIFIYKKLRLAT